MQWILRILFAEFAPLNDRGQGWLLSELTSIRPDWHVFEQGREGGGIGEGDGSEVPLIEAEQQAREVDLIGI